MGEAVAAGIRFLTFRLGESMYALPAGAVSAIVRVPAAARVPQAPPSLIGLVNLRGSILPLVSCAALVGRPNAELTDRARALVLDRASRVALAVEAVEAIVSTRAAAIEVAPAEPPAAAEPLLGAFRTEETGEVAKVLDIEALLATAFSAGNRRVAPGPRTASPQTGPEHATDRQEHQRIVTFDAAGQEYALPLAAVREILRLPEAITAVPRTEALALGFVAFRGGLLPLLSLRGLLGFPPAAAADGREKVVVTAVEGALVGLAVDRVRDVLLADPALMEPTPAVLAARAQGEARVQAIMRSEDGRRLISVLAPDRLMREEPMQRTGAFAARGGAGRQRETEEMQGAGEAEIQLLVFRLGEGEFALPVEAVDEVVRAPTEVTRLPKTPAFLEGVINLRGAVLPIIDQRRRFDMPPSEIGERRRLIVARTEAHHAGLIVDSVAEVLRVRANLLGPPPELAGGAAEVIASVVNLPETGRIILLLDPSTLLSRAERSLLDAFASNTAGTKASSVPP